DISKAEIAKEALEDIADIIEQTQDIGGINEQTADIINTVITPLTENYGVAFESLDKHKFASLSKRVNYSLEAVSNIRETVSFVVKKIIEIVKKLYGYIKQAYQFYRADAFKETQRLVAIKAKFNNMPKAVAVEDELEGSFAGVLLQDKKN